MDEPRQLIVLLDGTNNTLTGGREDTNLIRALECLTPPQPGQQVFYDPGVGNAGTLPGATRADKIKRRWQRLQGLAFGNGVYDNIGAAYSFLARQHQAGDQIFIFGFSRGAFEARALAGLVNMFGLLRVNELHMVPSLLSIYFSERRTSRAKAAGKREAIIRQTRELLVDPDRHDVWVHFLGVWDTVASIGIPPFDRQITGSPSMKDDSGNPKRYRHVRQALALDEQRRAFMPRPYLESNFDDSATTGQTLTQLWFHGDHCDVGGGHATDAGLARQALLWLLAEAQGKGLSLNATYASLVQQSGSSGPKCIHSETYVTPWWAIAGLKLRFPAEAVDENEHPQPIVPVAYSDPSGWAPGYPHNTVWKDRRPAGPLVLALALGLLLYVLMGWALLGWSTGSDELRIALGRIAAANNAFAVWQLTAWHGAPWPLAGPPGSAAGTALLLDLGFIACYGYVLARLCTRAFARIAGVRAITSAKHAWLNGLGCGLMVTVLADLAEDALTWLVLPDGWLEALAVSNLLPSLLADFLLLLTSGLMALAVIAKWAGGVMVLGLLAWGVFKRP
jgi:uncharacterized protein (DUF2235 family)